LCGQGSVAAILNITEPGTSLNKVVEKFVGFLKSQSIYKIVRDSDGNPLDSNGNITEDPNEFVRTEDPNYTGAYHLGQLINQGFNEFWRADVDLASNDLYSVDYWGGWEGIAHNVRRWLPNRYVIAGININGNTGQLRNGLAGGGFANDGASHWVVITGISNEWDRPGCRANGHSRWKWVRVYNPFDNQTEYYWWGDFENSWRTDGGAMLRVSRLPIIDPCQFGPC